MNAKELLLEFLSEDFWPHAEWLYADELKVYVRKAKRYINKQMVRTLDIANITVYEPGQGTFKNFLQFAMENCPWEYVYIENVQDPNFEKWFLTNGWTQATQESPLSFWMEVK